MPETTCMRDSLVGDAWIKAACEQNPVQPVLDAEGKPTGNFLTGPVRLAFTDSVFKAQPKMKTDPKSALAHSVAVLFTPFTNMQLMWDEYYRICASDFAEYWNGDMQQYVGIDNPITDQGFKAVKYSGFTTGLWTTNMSSQFKPPVVDMRGNPITDESKVYAGVWAIVAFNSYASGKNFPKKGPRFGLASIMLIGDDKPLAGGAIDTRQAFKGVQVRPPIAVPAGNFGLPGPGAPPPGGGAPGAAYYPPGGYGAAPHLPAPPTAPRPPHAPPLTSSDPDEDISQFMR